MSNLTYNGKTFNQRDEDGYVNLGQLCATHGKRYSNWARLESSKEYLISLAETLTESGTQILAPYQLIISAVDSIGGDAGTWGHPLVAIEVARWISPAFGVWCNMHIKHLLEVGSTAIVQEVQSSFPPIQSDMTLAMLTQAIQGLAGLANHVQAQHLLIQQQQQQINLLLDTKHQAEAELQALPIAEVPAPEKPTRAKVNEIVRNYCHRNKVGHQQAWNKLYKELYYRCHIDVDARCRNRKGAKLDIVEEAGFMEQLHAIASEILC